MVIERLAQLLARLMPAFFERVDSGQWIGDSEALDNAVIPTARATERRRRTALSPSYPLPAVVRNELKSVETEIKYSGYLDQQSKAIERLKRSEQRLIPDWFDYAQVSGLSREMNEKLARVRPRTLGQASRIPGVTPAAVSLINVYIEIQARRQAGATGTPITIDSA